MPSLDFKWLGKRVGSEGYGSHIRDVAANGTPEDALAAYRQIGWCRDALPDLVAIYEKTRAQSNPARGWYDTPEFLNREAARLQGEQVRCQTVDADVQGLALQLAKRAALGRVNGGAEAYADAVAATGNYAAWPEVLELLRSAADRMDTGAFSLLARGDRSIPLGDVERTAYELALQRLEDEGWPYLGGATRRYGELQPAYVIHLRAADLAEATRLSDVIYQQCCKEWKHKH